MDLISTRHTIGRRALCLLLSFVMVSLMVLPAMGMTIAVVTTESAPQAGELVSDDGLVTIAYGADAGIPDGAAIRVTEVTDTEWYLNVAEGMLGDGKKAVYSRFFDIDVVSVSGERVSLLAPVEVKINIADAPVEENTGVSVFHFADEAETIEEDGEIPLAAPEMSLKGLRSNGAALSVKGEDGVLPTDAEDRNGMKNIEEVHVTGNTGETVSFLANGFSVYGVIFTVDFTYAVDGLEFAYSITGGSGIALSELLPVLGVTEDNPETEEDEVWSFVNDVDTVEFSDPSLVWVGKVEEDCTVGQLKAVYMLSSEYSSELTEEQTAEIDEKTLKAGDWVLISMLPFASEETMTVTMSNGDQWMVKVTDAQIKDTYMTARGETYEITVTYDDDAHIPDGTELSVHEIEEDSDEYLQLLGDSWSYINREYLECERRGINGEADDARNERLYVRNILQACFFDIAFMYQGEKIEPDAPVQVIIRLKDGLDSMDTAESYVLHYAGSDEEEKDAFDETEISFGKSLPEADNEMRTAEPELIEEVRTTGSADRIHSFSFEQGSFSVDGLVTAVKASGTVRNAVSLRASTANETLTPPKAHKWKTDNEDGTYKIHMNITGDSQSSEKVKKANVILVLDKSSSMDYGKYYYIGNAQNGVIDGFEPIPNVTYHSNNTYQGGLFEANNTLTYSNGKFYSNGRLYSGAVYYFKSRMEHEQEAVSAMISELLSQNKPGQTTSDGTKLDDIVEIAMVSYNSSATIECDWTTSESALNNALDNIELGNYTHWWDGLDSARTLAQNIKQAQPDEEVYVLFMTDGTPLQRGLFGLPAGDNWDGCERSVRNLMKLGYVHLYDIFTYGGLQDMAPGRMNPAIGRVTDTSYLQRLTEYAKDYGSKDATFYDAEDSEAMLNILGNITSLITNSVAYGRVSVTDTLTSNASATALVNGKADGFTYTVSGTRSYMVTASGDKENPTVTFTIDGQPYPGEKKTGTDNKPYYEVTVGNQVYKMTLATFNESTHKVDWDLGGIGTLEKGCTYEVSFDMWPNQDAYDYVADLNNKKPGVSWNQSAATPVYTDDTNTTVKYYKGGVAEYPDIVKYGENGPYAVLTNTDQEVTYSIVKNTNGTITYDGPYTKKLETPDPMNLTDRKIRIQKVWEDALDTSQLSKVNSITLKLKQGDGDYITGIQINPVAEKTWPERDASNHDILHDISAGLMISEGKATASGLKTVLEQHTDKYQKVSDGTTTYYILDKGYDYSFVEVEGDTHFELEKKIFHPMVVDGQLRDVTFSSAADGSQTAEISNLPVTEQGSSTVSLQAKNVLKGGINITKTVKNTSEQPLDYDGLFTAEITLTPPEDDTNIEDYWEEIGGNKESKGKVAWYYYIDENGNQLYDEALIQAGILEDSGETNSYGRIGKGENYDGGGWFVLWFRDDTKEESMHDASGTLILSPKYPIRFTNMASGTGYSLQETETNGMTPSITYSHTDAEGNPVDGSQVVIGNTANNIDVVNKTTTAKIKVLKVDMGNTSITLEGVKFELYSDEACTKQVVKDASGTDIGSKEIIDGIEHQAVLTTDENGELLLGILVKGKYYLKEIMPKPGYNMLKDHIAINIIGNKVIYGLSMKEAEFDEGIYTIVVANSTGYELPSTGGRGTAAFTLAGLTLAITSGTILTHRFYRRKEE